MTPLMTYLAAFGVSAGAGAKAFVPIVLLGGLHYTRYFELSDRFLWIADPAVMIVLGVLVIAELVVDAHPDLGQFADELAYLPKFVAGFITGAAVVGTVDENLVALGASGVLGGGAATGVHWLRNQIRKPFRIAVEDVHEGFGKAAALTEAGASLSVAGSAVLLPPLSLAIVAALSIAALLVGRAVDRRRVACSHCGEPIRPHALVCFHCGAEQTASAAADA